jgi:hypothetical protein
MVVIVEVKRKGRIIVATCQRVKQTKLASKIAREKCEASEGTRGMSYTAIMTKQKGMRGAAQPEGKLILPSRTTFESKCNRA